jgi:hypothetical protein
MRLFRSRIGSEVYFVGGRYFFITSDEVRRYSVREATANGDVKTVGTFRGYSTRAAAVRAIESGDRVGRRSRGGGEVNKHEQMMERIEKHGRDLLAIFPGATEQDPVKLCKKLRRLEGQAAAVALRMCNGPEFTREDEPDELLDAILAKVDALLAFNAAGVPAFINRDPRGYALKIHDEWMVSHSGVLHRDWGGYGIIAPDLTEAQ